MLVRDVFRAVERVKSFVFVVLFAMVATAAFGQANLPPTWVFARAYNSWSLIGQQANTFTFNGGVCNFPPYNNGNTPSFFAFSGTQGGSTVYYPVAILDANPTLSEIVTPTSTIQSTATCGFSAAPVNQHVSFTLQSGTAGLQEAVATQMQAAPPSVVLLDKYWYDSVFALPGNPTPESLIKAATGNTAVQIVDTTTSPWTYWRWSGTAYSVVGAVTGGAAPTAAAGAALGTSPTGPTNTGDGNSFSVAVTTGTATTTGTVFTETWATTASFTYPPACRVYSSGTNAFPPITTAVTFTASHAVLTVAAAAAPIVSTAYTFKVVCN